MVFMTSGVVFGHVAAKNFKNLFLLPFGRMWVLLPILSLVCLLAVVSCGPEIIRLRPRLDTPAHHVDNGYKLMAYGKTAAAMREFKRSMELNPEYAPAYVGLGIVYGMEGDLDQGRTLMKKAKSLARNAEQKKEVEMGFERLDYIEGEKQ